jgi:UDP-GlcNAc:undecaprenyl-phosphate GlcNAc-1-phosphate transferase
MPIFELIIIGMLLTVSTAIAFFITPFIIKLAKKIDLMDVPADERRMHHEPIPLLGGLSIIAAFIVTSIFACLIVLRYFDITYLHTLQTLLIQILPGAIIIAGVAFIDDKVDLPAWPRLIMQFVAAGITVALGVRIQAISGSVSLFGAQAFELRWLSIPVTILWIVGVTNALNWIDGLDGLAAGTSSIAAVSMLLIAVFQHQPQFIVALLTAALAGGCIGLLPYNRHPAKIFMGDTGAMFLGFTLAVISIQGLFKFYAAISFSVPLLVLGLPLFDTATAIIRRLAEGKSPFTADRNHIHHKLIDLGLSQNQAVIILYSISIVLGIVALLFTIFGTIIGWRFMFAGTVLISVIFLSLLAIFRKTNQKNAADAAADIKSEIDEENKSITEKETKDNTKNGE